MASQSTQRARELRKRMTPAEARLWAHIRGKQSGCRYRRQHPLTPYVVDFACLTHRVVVECDGSQHGLSRYDERRDQYLEDFGYAVMRFWNNEILYDLDMVLRTIEHHLDPSFDRTIWSVTDRVTARRPNS